MHFKTLIDDDDAVSPVIGVILMVAITVILAAVIATFVLGLGENLSNTAPQASFSCDTSTGTITMTGGEQLTKAEITVSSGASENTGVAPYQAGDKVVDSGATTGTQVIWSQQGQSAILYECE